MGLYSVAVSLFIAAGFLTQAAAPALRLVVLPEVNSNCSSLDLAQLFDLSAVLEGYNFDKLFLFLSPISSKPASSYRIKTSHFYV